ALRRRAQEFGVVVDDQSAGDAVVDVRDADRRQLGEQPRVVFGAGGIEVVEGAGAVRGGPGHDDAGSGGGGGAVQPGVDDVHAGAGAGQGEGGGGTGDAGTDDDDVRGSGGCHGPQATAGVRRVETRRRDPGRPLNG